MAHCSRRPLKLAFALPLFLLGGSACVEYVPVEIGAVRPQEEVRVRFTDETAIRLARELGRITPLLEANFASQSSDSVALSIWLGRDYVGTPFENVRQTVAVSRDEVVEFRRKRLSVWKTAVVSAGVIAAFAYMIDQLVTDESPNPLPGDGIDPPPPSPLVIRIPFGFGGSPP